MGFSPVGLLIAIAVLAPGLLLAVLPPRPPLPRTGTHAVLVGLEHAGQLACLVLLVLCGAEVGPGPRDWVLVAVGACVVGYLGLWARYLARGRAARLLFDRLGPLPLPMAVLPVLVFAFSALWAGSVWLGIATVALAVGHLAVSRDTHRALLADDVRR